MIKVRFLTQVTATGAALLSLPMVGCAASQPDAVSTGAEAETGITAGAGTLTMHSYDLSYTSTTGGDEFLRVGERLTAAIAFNEAVEMLYVGDAGDEDAITAINRDPTKLKLSLKVLATKFDGTLVDLPALPMTFAPGPGGVVAATSPEFSIPAGVKKIAVDFLAEYPENGAQTKRMLLQTHGVKNDFTVFGAYAPNKLVLFDTMGADKRTRIVEGGSVVAGANLTVAVTDWRLDTVVDRSSLDLRYGRQESYSRFGTGVVDAIGQLTYALSAVISTDGGHTFAPLAFDQIQNADVLGQNLYGWRYAFEKLVQVPANAGPNVQIAFHIQAFLDVPNYYPGQIMDAKYSPGQRVLLKEVWDNNGGANYSLAVTSQ
jgi:hypothetical protein